MSIVISVPCARCLSQTSFQAQIMVSLPYKSKNVSLNGIEFQNLLLSPNWPLEPTIPFLNIDCDNNKGYQKNNQN